MSRLEWRTALQAHKIDRITDISPMPDHSFPEVNPSLGFHSVFQSLVEQKSGFSPLPGPTQKPWNVPEQTYNPPQAPLRPMAFAEPLTPLRQRDEQALEEVFDDAQVEDMIADICHRLRQLYPEPCWEDDPFEFLQGYL